MCRPSAVNAVGYSGLTAGPDRHSTLAASLYQSSYLCWYLSSYRSTLMAPYPFAEQVSRPAVLPRPAPTSLRGTEPGGPDGPGPCGRLSTPAASGSSTASGSLRSPVRNAPEPAAIPPARPPRGHTLRCASRPVPPADSWHATHPATQSRPHPSPQPGGRETAGATGLPHISRPRRTANPARPTPPERQHSDVYISQWMFYLALNYL